MKQNVKIVARTFEMSKVAEKSGQTVEQLEAETVDDLRLLSGKAAGVCYMPDDYLEEGIQNEDKALARANQTAKSGHHSVYDHGHISFVMKTNKMMCMILNSLGVYTTSEKSARYTKMQPETELELQLYEKWKSKIKELILAKYPDTDDTELSKRLCKKMGVEFSPIVVNGEATQIKEDEWLEKELAEIKKSETLPSSKLAQENARYMISVFTPTTMMHTVSFRQAQLILNYLANLSVNIDEADDMFSKSLREHVPFLASALIKAMNNKLGENDIHDNKNQHVRFLEAQHIGNVIRHKDACADFDKYTDIDARLEAKKEVIGDSYTLVYYGSLAMLAQAQRHRTLRYTMLLREPVEFGFYTPEIIKEAGLEDEWQSDIKSVAYCVPQGTIVRITEQGIFEDFALKCKERLCGRAQLEVMKSTVESLKKFINNKDALSYDNVKLLESMTLDKDERGCVGLTPCPRCMFKDFKCAEGCQWGAKEALKRSI